MNTKSKKIETIVKDLAKKERLELIECRLFNSAGKLVLRCLVDYPQGGITLDKCGQFNRIIFERLENDFSEVDKVEVNSPGLDRPLKRERDFRKVKGKVILVWLREPLGGKNFIEAKLKEVDKDSIFCEDNQNQLEIKINNIKIAKQKFR